MTSPPSEGFVLTHFIVAEDVARSRDFYLGVLGGTVVLDGEPTIVKLLASEHADVLRESVAWIVAELMEAEVTAQIGAELGERTPARLTQRNGYRTRYWDTRVGELELRIPRLRTGS
jgi:Transposase, Mutator family